MRFTLNPKFSTDVVRQLRRCTETQACYSVSGAFDLIAVVAAETAMRLHELLQEFGELEGVERTTSSIVLVTEFDRR